jgi:hypothetical protein
MGAIETFLVLIIIGAGIGFAMNRYGHSWLGRHVAGAAGAGEVTYALVGIAGSFMGFHFGLILGLLNTFVLYLVAAAGAALTIWLWRGRR